VQPGFLAVPRALPEARVSDVTFATNFLNISYVDGDLIHLASVRANPSIKLFQIKEAGGASVESRFMLRGAAGMSGNLTDAQSIAAQNKNGRHYRWQVPFGKTRGSFRIPYEDIMASKLDEAAEAKALELEMEKGSAECGSKLVQLLFGRSGLAGGYGEYEETASGGTTPASRSASPIRAMPGTSSRVTTWSLLPARAKARKAWWVMWATCSIRTWKTASFG
jgi:hypothetical protein